MNDDEILSRLNAIRDRAWVPDSHFHVTALIRDHSGDYHDGVNWEVPDRRSGTCAEGAAIARMLARVGAKPITDLWVSGVAEQGGKPRAWLSPCGNCRQLIGEFAAPEMTLHMVRGDLGAISSVSFSQWAAQGVSHQALGRSPFPEGHLAVLPGWLMGEGLSEGHGEAELLDALSTLLIRAVAPDGGRREAAILESRGGRFFAGVSLGTSNYKSSMGAISAALASLITAVGRQDVSRVWYVADDARAEGVAYGIRPSWAELETLRPFGSPEFVWTEGGKVQSRGDLGQWVGPLWGRL